MNWFVSLFEFIITEFYFLQSCCFPSRKEALIKEKDFVDDENNNTKQNSDNIEGSK